MGSNPIGRAKKFKKVENYIISIILFATIVLLYSLLLLRRVSRLQAEKEEIQKKFVDISKIERLKNDFLTIAEHQLRTPLSGVKWTFEMLKLDKTISQDSMGMIEMGLGRIQDSMSIINTMIKTVEQKEGAMTSESTDIVGLIRSIISELNFIVIKNHIKPTFIAPESPMIKVDKEKLKPALSSIIDNAFKYSPNGMVDISLEDLGNTVLFKVKDNGIGIDSADMPYLFERLHRGKNAMRLEPDESGVGLYASKKIIELHGGTIRIESQLDKGTLVTVMLPK